ncbi:MAG: flagellin [Myxococcota bacterium]
MLNIVTNTASMQASRALSRNQRALAQSFQRLSTGLRINSAKDDAAGLAIANRLTSQYRGLVQASRNAGDSISLLQTAESAISEQQNMLQRLRELAVQSASDTNTVADRTAIAAEADALVSEIERVATQTSYNGRNLLDGSLSAVQFQIGSEANETVAVTLRGTRSFNLGSVYTADFTLNTTPFADGDLTLNGVSIDAAVAADDTLSPATDADHSAIALAAVINEKAADTGVTATANANVVTGSAAVGGSLTIDFEINGQTVNIPDGTNNTLANDSDGAIRNAINAVSGSSGVVATLDASNQLVLTAQDGRNIVITNLSTAEGTDIGIGTTSVNIGTVTVKSEDNITFGSSGTQTNVTAAPTAALSNVNLDTVALGTQAGATAALTAIDDSIAQLNDRQADIGALLNRMDNAINAISAAAENIAAARGRIQDADFAAETAAFSKNQILQQASTSMLAQANVQGQLALSLLG